MFFAIEVYDIVQLRHGDLTRPSQQLKTGNLEVILLRPLRLQICYEIIDNDIREHKLNYMGHALSSVSQDERPRDIIGDIPPDFYTSIIDSVSDYILVIDEAHRVVIANGPIQVFFELMTDNGGELTGRTMESLFIADREKVTEAVIGVFSTGESQIFQESWDNEDRILHFRVTAFPFFIKSRVGYCLLIFRNVTSEVNEKKLILGQKRHMEDQVRQRTLELRNSNTRLALFKNIIDTARYGSVVLDSNKTILYANEYAANIHGYTVEDLIRQPITLLYGNDQVDALEEILRESVEHGSAPSMELVHLYKGGIRFPMLCSSSAITDSKGQPRYYAMAFQDISAQREAQETLQRAKQTAEENTKAKSAFLANMSHEIRTPLNAVIGFSELLNETDLSSMQKDYSQKILSSGKLLLSLINDVLDFSKIEAGKMSLSETPFFIHAFLDELLSMFRVRAARKGLVLVDFIDPSLPLKISLDEIRLRQVIMNLLGNALKFTDTGSVAIEASFRQTSDDRGDLILTVADTGIGIEPENQERIFRAFEQNGELDNRRFNGTGLGLSISLHIIRMFNGTLELESKVDHGSRFTVTIPEVLFSNERNAVMTNAASSEIRFEGQTVVVVEDDPINSNLMASILHEAGLKTQQASSGEEALRIVRESMPHLVVTDIRMKPMSGFELMEAFRREFPDSSLPIVAVTAMSPESASIPVESGKFDGLLRKPYTKKQVLETICPYLSHEVLLEETAPKEVEDERFTLILNGGDVKDLLLDPGIVSAWRNAKENVQLSTVKSLLGALDRNGLTPDSLLVLEYIDQLSSAAESFDIIRMRELLEILTNAIDEVIGDD